MTDGEGANGRDELEPVTCGLAADGCEALDILVVLDNSGSIHPETEELLIPRFGTVLRLDFGELLRQTCRYHLGVTSTEPSLDPQAPADCRVRGALNRRAVGDTSRDCFGDIATHPEPYMRPPDPPVDAVACMAAVGRDQEPDEHQVETILAALSEPLNEPGACNEGFLQPDSKLLVILITDEDDDDDRPHEPGRTGSPGTPASWVLDLQARKSLTDIAFVLIAPIDLLTVDGPACGPFEPILDDATRHNRDGVGAEYAPRLRDFWLRTQTGGALGLQIDLCDPDALTDQTPRIVEIARELCRAP